MYIYLVNWIIKKRRAMIRRRVWDKGVAWLKGNSENQNGTRPNKSITYEKTSIATTILIYNYPCMSVFYSNLFVQGIVFTFFFLVWSISYFTDCCLMIWGKECHVIYLCSQLKQLHKNPHNFISIFLLYPNADFSSHKTNIFLLILLSSFFYIHSLRSSNPTIINLLLVSLCLAQFDHEMLCSMTIDFFFFKKIWQLILV